MGEAESAAERGELHSVSEEIVGESIRYALLPQYAYESFVDLI